MKTEIVTAALAATLISACGVTAPTSGPTTTATNAPTPDTSNNGLIAARYSQCDKGALIMRYLATGNNEGNSDLDKALAQYVGTTGPRARALADSAIDWCNTQYDNQAAAQARAEASAQASASTQASSDAQAAQGARLAVVQQHSCAAIGGTASEGQCKSSTPNKLSTTANALCGYAAIDFNDDGSISQSSYNTNKQYYPDCF